MTEDSKPDPADQPGVPSPPRQTKASQVTAKVVEGAVSTVPFVGGPLAVVIATVFGYAFSRRVAESPSGETN